jgi:hypothetical protein
MDQITPEEMEAMKAMKAQQLAAQQAQAAAAQVQKDSGNNGPVMLASAAPQPRQPMSMDDLIAKAGSSQSPSPEGAAADFSRKLASVDHPAVKKQIEEQIGAKVKDKDLHGVTSMLRGAQEVVKGGGDPLQSHPSDLKAADPVAPGPKEDSGDIDKQTMILKSIMAIAPTLLGGVFGGKQGAAVGAQTTGKFFGDVAESEQKKLDAANKSKEDAIAFKREVDAKKEIMGEENKFKSGESEKDRAARSYELAQQAGYAQKLEEMKLQKDAEVAAKKLTSDQAEKLVPGLGVVGTKEGAEKLMQSKVETEQAMSSLKRLKEISMLDSKSLSPELRAEAQTHAAFLLGNLRTKVVGPGAMSEQERKILEGIAVDPTAVLSFDNVNRAKLDAAIGKIGRDFYLEAKGRGIDFNSGDALNSEYAKYNFSKEDIQKELERRKQKSQPTQMAGGQ